MTLAGWLRMQKIDAVLRADAMNVTPGPAGIDAPLDVRENSEEAAAGAQPAPIVPVAHARETRYRELLASTPPKPPAPVPEPALVQRAAAPVLQAASDPGPQPAVAPAVAPPESGVRPPRPQEASRQRASSSPADSPDPDSDIAAPQLLSAAFLPAEIKDGEETILSVVVADNLSGVRSVTGVIASPSGSLQGFAAQRSGEQGRFSARIVVPKQAPEGVWHVRHLTLTDNVNNVATLNYSQGALPPTASFRVLSAAGDSKGPVLKAVWLERSGMRGGERNTVFIQADDEGTGVAVVSGLFVSPSRVARLGFGCRPGANDTWECVVTPPSCLDCGTWRLEQVQVQDKANNLSTFRTDHQLVGSVMLDVSGDRCDASPPVVTALILEPRAISNSDGGFVRVQAIVEDDACGVATLSGLAIAPAGSAGQRAPFAFEPSLDGRTFVGRIPVQKHAARGLWRIAWVQALDKGLNLRTYSADEPVINAATFRVE